MVLGLLVAAIACWVVADLTGDSLWALGTAVCCPLIAMALMYAVFVETDVF